MEHFEVSELERNDTILQLGLKIHGLNTHNLEIHGLEILTWSYDTQPLRCELCLEPIKNLGSARSAHLEARYLEAFTNCILLVPA